MFDQEFAEVIQFFKNNDVKFVLLRESKHLVGIGAGKEKLEYDILTAKEEYQRLLSFFLGRGYYVQHNLKHCSFNFVKR